MTRKQVIAFVSCLLAWKKSQPASKYINDTQINTVLETVV